MVSKNCLVTGATGGLGEVTARELARMGAHVTLVARSEEKARATMARIREAVPDAKLELLLGDLSVMAEVRRVAREYREQNDRLHVLVNNAGAVFTRRELTKDGYERTFALNHLAYFLLTRELKELLLASAPARVVSVSSFGHVFGKLELDDLMSERGPYVGLRVYSTSKLANILFANELARRLAGTGVTSNSVHPGMVATGFGRNNPGLFNWMVSTFRFTMVSPDEGARTTVHVATAPELEGVTGQYFVRGKPRRPSRRARDEEVARRLWEESEKLCAAK